MLSLLGVQVKVLGTRSELLLAQVLLLGHISEFRLGFLDVE